MSSSFFLLSAAAASRTHAPNGTQGPLRLFLPAKGGLLFCFISARHFF
jgi:hypothetical protein